MTPTARSIGATLAPMVLLAACASEPKVELPRPVASVSSIQASVSNGHFSARRPGLRCEGSYDVLTTRYVLTVTARCSDGRVGVAKVTLDRALPPSGELRLLNPDNSESVLVFGRAPNFR